MNSKRIEQMCRQLSGLLGLLVQMQAIQGPAGQPTQHKSSSLFAAAAGGFCSWVMQSIFWLNASDKLRNLYLSRAGQFI